MHIAILLVLAFAAGVFMHRYLARVREAKATDPITPSSPYEASVASATFEAMVLRASSETPVLVDFYAAWCPPCQYLGPVLAEMAQNYKGEFLLAKVDVDAEPSLSRAYNIRSMPTVVLFRNGRNVAQFVGAREKHSIRYFLAQNGVLPPEEQPGV